MDYTVSGLSYDANGNILSMNQNGFKIGSPAAPIDQLTYSYQPNSNKLLQVTDAVNDTGSVLGDFHYKTKGAYDYSYDGNGSLVLDNNKGIDTIGYNYLNLSQLVHMQGKGNIRYTYDATGNKLQKRVIDSVSGLATTTLYLDGFQYQRRTPIGNLSAGTDTLQFVGHEEGRARWAYHKYTNGDSAYAWEYDFTEKDHLGNTRVLLTQEKDTASYTATMEARFRKTEDALFYGLETSSYARAGVMGYPNDTTYGSPNDSVARVNGNGPKTGPAIILKVMSGDKVDIGAQYYYQSMTNTNGPSLQASDLLNSLASGLAGLSAPAHEAFSSLNNSSSSPLLAALNSSLNNQNGADPSKPQAYLNWVLLDNQFNYVGGNNQSGALQVGASGTQSGGQLQAPLAYKGLPITKSGYLYIYVSNATPGWDVFFDNLSVTHYSGAMLEENHYYPGGLTMAGISDKALKGNYAENKYRFNGGNELQNKEFSDGSGLETYDATHRMYDPQIGRFFQIDRLGEISISLSPYAFVVDNPILRNDPLGDTATLPTVTVTALNPNSLTAKINQLGFGGVDAWVGMMMTQYHHSASAIDNWAMRNKYLSRNARNWILNGTSDASVKYRKSMEESWKAQGKLYKFFFISALTGPAGEVIGGVVEAGEEGVALEDAVEEGVEEGMEEAGSAGVQANKAAGDAWRDEVAEGLQQEGREVSTEVTKKTPFGVRRVDIEVKYGGKVQGGIETKVGGSPYTPAQRIKDLWLEKVEGYPVNVVRKP
jgi:RHS repeat-associated protein